MRSAYLPFMVSPGLLLMMLLPWLAAAPAFADEQLATVAANRADEPLTPKFSLARAVQFLDQAAVDWQQQRGCFTCHTNAAYLMSRPQVQPLPDAHRQVRDFAEQLVNERWQKQGPRWDAEVVVAAAMLAINDANTTGKLHASTRSALDRMWSLQREDGGWDWLKCDWPPMESDDHYGATLAAIAVGTAPEDYANTQSAQSGMHKLRRYLADNSPPMLHHKGMLLWADSLCSDLVTDEQRQAWIQEFLNLQKLDGGWGIATLGDWQRNDGKSQDTENSDGYGTGFVIYVLRQAGLSANDERLQRGIGWLKSNQRASGRWFTRSLYKDNKHYISHAGTSMAVLAITACETRNERRNE